MAALTPLTEANFAAEVLDAETPVLVYFTTPHCPPCKMVTPIVTDLAEEWAGRVRVGTVDIDDNFKTTLRYTVMSAPTLLLFVGGKPVERVTGFLPKAKLLAKLAPHLAP